MIRDCGGLSAVNDKVDRADKVLVELGHFDSRAAAQAAIRAGKVMVSGRTLSKPSEKIARDARVSAEPAHPWVSRAGLKLDHALDAFGVAVTGLHCLDIGASTGGFTQVLLARGAASVVAVDVGRGQLHALVSSDPRVIAIEAKDARSLTQADVGAPPQIIVCDASFISLAKLLPVPLSLAARPARLVTLFKPQFEVGPAYVGKGGIVSDTQAAAEAEDRFAAWLASCGWEVLARADSPITGSDGNRERLLLAQNG